MATSSQGCQPVPLPLAIEYVVKIEINVVESVGLKRKGVVKMRTDVDFEWAEGG